MSNTESWLALSAYLVSLAIMAAFDYKRRQRERAAGFHAGWCAGARFTGNFVRVQLAARGIAIEFANAPDFEPGRTN